MIRTIILSFAFLPALILVSGCGRSDREVKTSTPTTRSTEPGHEPESQDGSVDGEKRPSAEQKDLFLKRGGLYTAADVEANGKTTPFVKFKGMKPQHDDNVRVGNPVCPVSGSKPDSRFRWTVAGKEYTFCCPPCVEEFVRDAKEHPERIREPGSYIKKRD